MGLCVGGSKASVQIAQASNASLLLCYFGGISMEHEIMLRGLPSTKGVKRYFIRRPSRKSVELLRHWIWHFAGADFETMRPNWLPPMPSVAWASRLHSIRWARRHRCVPRRHWRYSFRAISGTPPHVCQGRWPQIRWEWTSRYSRARRS